MGTDRGEEVSGPGGAPPPPPGTGRPGADWSRRAGRGRPGRGPRPRGRPRLRRRGRRVARGMGFQTGRASMCSASRARRMVSRSAPNCTGSTVMTVSQRVWRPQGASRPMGTRKALPGRSPTLKEKTLVRIRSDCLDIVYRSPFDSVASRGSPAGGWRPTTRSAARMEMTRSRFMASASTVVRPSEVTPMTCKPSADQTK